MCMTNVGSHWKLPVLCPPLKGKTPTYQPSFGDLNAVLRFPLPESLPFLNCLEVGGRLMIPTEG